MNSKLRRIMESQNLKEIGNAGLQSSVFFLFKHCIRGRQWINIATQQPLQKPPERNRGGSGLPVGLAYKSVT